ncbi:hypothetical protein J4206_00835, partial [Candidatus Woesearchaeota archaeon]|nr:hypothetical protein [Candidatus Woesearchaeota archaeon]
KMKKEEEKVHEEEEKVREEVKEIRKEEEFIKKEEKQILAAGKKEQKFFTGKKIINSKKSNRLNPKKKRK